MQQLQLSAEVPLDWPRHRALLLLLLLLFLLVRRRRRHRHVIAAGRTEGGTTSGGHELSCACEGVRLRDPSQDRWVRVELA